MKQLCNLTARSHLSVVYDCLPPGAFCRRRGDTVGKVFYVTLHGDWILVCPVYEDKTVSRSAALEIEILKSYFEVLLGVDLGFTGGKVTWANDLTEPPAPRAN